VMRDMMCQEVPAIFVRHIYALAATAGSCLYYVLISINASDVPSAVIAIVFTVSIRVLARYYRWNLPRIKDDEK
ncbi:MAG: TRIC cation channel family protein, partial [Oscillospiraceae bacterium]|nr:TRIC cation channel family protein [Oscillospiraceae bacterium]